MGQRHQLFIIARIGSKVRSLAALHHQWLYGELVPKVCQRLIEVFQEPGKHALLRYELELAALLPEEVWQSHLPWYDVTPRFPFIATCVLLSSTFDPISGKNSNANEEPWNMAYNAGHNDDGMTLLDITDPTKVRYVFVHEEKTLSGAEYLQIYDRMKRESEFEESADYEDEDFDYDEILNLPTPPLREEPVTASQIDEAFLADIWVHAEQQKRKGPLWYATAAEDWSKARAPAIPRGPALVSAHGQYAKVFEALQVEERPGPREELSTRKPGIKQLMFVFTTWEDKPLSTRIRQKYNPGEMIREHSDHAMRIWALPLDDADMTVSTLLQGLETWTQSSADHDGFRRWFNYCSSITGVNSIGLIKSLAVGGEDWRVVKPIPAKAYAAAKQAFHCSAFWISSSMADIKPDEWTAICWHHWDIPKAEKCDDARLTWAKTAFCTRNERGGLTVTDANEFIKAMDGDVTGPLRDTGSSIAGVPVSALKLDEVQEILEVVGKATEIEAEVLSCNVGRMREAWCRDEVRRRERDKVKLDAA